MEKNEEIKKKAGDSSPAFANDLDTKNILSDEVAKVQVQIFLDFYDFDVSDAPPSQKPNLVAGIRRITKAIRRGHVEIKKNEEGRLVVVQNLVNKPGTHLTYETLSGKSKVALGEESRDNDYGRIYAMVGSLTNVGTAGIRSLYGVDLSIAEVLGMLFLAV